MRRPQAFKTEDSLLKGRPPPRLLALIEFPSEPEALLTHEPEEETRSRPVTPGRGAPPAPDVPDRIGSYRILQVLGSGGMGVVYMAEQTEPVSRRVALKVVKLGMDTNEVVARFEAERQALALMDHPGIAKVYEAGATASGRPYFAMELVKGMPFTEYCDKQRLRTRARVELFIEVCRAVQHAHQKGVMHRDLKPSNVLVTVIEDRPAPKIIDFGIAKAMDRRLTERTLVTELGAAIGTPAYMSPEQLSVSGLDVDTRTDIYSLGVMLYEVLTGMLPREVTGAAPRTVQALRTTDDDPMVPSARISSLGGDQGRTIASNHGTDKATLYGELKGDLDWISMKAMARDRTQRYEAASSLALDLQRYLRNEPIVARPPSARYRMGKFVRRHRVGVAVAAAMAVLLVGFVAAMATQATRVAHERDRAEREAARVTALNRFMTDMLGSADPWGGGKRDVTVVEALRKSADKVERSYKDEPLLAATARQAIGKTFLGLGRLDDAEPLLQQALGARRAAFGPAHREVAESVAELASLHSQRGRYEEAAKEQREAVSILEKTSGPESEPVAEALTQLTNILFLKGEYDEAKRLAQRALETRRRLFGPRSEKFAATLSELSTVVGSGKGDYTQAEALVRECLAIRREVLGPENADVAATLNDLAVIRAARRDFKEAESLYREALAIHRKVLGEEHPVVASCLENLAGVLFRTGRYREALELLDQVLALRKKGLGEDSLAVARTLHNRAVVLNRAGQKAAAEAGFRESLARLRQALGADHPEMAQALANYGRLQRDQKNYAAAEKTLRESLDIAVRRMGPDHPSTRAVELDLAEVLVLTRRPAEAEPALLRSLKAAEAGSDTASARRAAEQLVKVYDATGRPAEAETYRRKIAALPPTK
jgi:serine/threonine protein kinase/tetratricopeptide (TPR) repeat protein